MSRFIIVSVSVSMSFGSVFGISILNMIWSGEVLNEDVVLIRLLLILWIVVLIRCVMNGVDVMMSGMIVVVELIEVLVISCVNGMMVMMRMMKGVECVVLIMMLSM